MTRTSPFKFLDSYQKDDLDIFFGREKETENLYDALSGVKHLLVYGPSGAGKTSLIECGLRNQFSDADWLAITVRRGSDLNAAVFARIREQLREPFDLDPATKLPADAGFEFGDAVERLFAEQYKPVYLLFDQFEELLIQGSDAEKQQFFTRLQRLIRYKTPCRILLIMREEFIGHLSEFEPLCPSLFQHRFRLEKMGRANVRTVIRQMLEADKYRSAFRVEQPEHLANTILAKLPDTQREIELAHVQVFLGELWDRAASQPLKAEALPVLHGDLVKEDDNLERVLDRFLKNQLQELAPAHGEKAPLELLAAMISERYTKLQLSAADLETALTKNAVALQQPLPDLLRELEQRRILRTLKSGEQTQYEISHDVLARVVGQNLTEDMKLREKAREIYRVYGERKGMFSREDLDYLRAFEGYLEVPEGLRGRMVESEKQILANQQQELEKALAERRRTRLVAAGGFLLAALAVLAAVFAFQQSREAKKQETAALFQKKQADSLLVIAQNNQQLADDKTRLADENLATAKREEDKARLALSQVKQEKNATEAQRLEALKNFEVAKREKEKAENQLAVSKLMAAQKFPENFDLLISLDTLDCTGWGLGLDSLSPEIEKLVNLKKLNLTLNLLTCLPNQIWNLKNLTELSLSSNQLTSLPEQIGNLKNLTSLHLSSNQITSLPEQIGNLENLTVLDLSSNEFINLPEQIRNFQNLKELDLSYNNFINLPEQIGNLKNLKKLDLIGNPLPETEKAKIKALLPNCEIYF
jgi:hypothetical protein